jgi:hypothetical protein
MVVLCLTKFITNPSKIAHFCVIFFSNEIEKMCICSRAEFVPHYQIDVHSINNFPWNYGTSLLCFVQFISFHWVPLFFFKYRI